MSLHEDHETWAQWEAERLAGVQERERAFEAQRARTIVQAHRPSLEDLQMWNRYLHECNEGLADAVAEFVGLVPGARWFFAARGLDV